MPGIYYPQARAILSVVFDGFGGDDSDPLVIHVFPKSVSVHLNGYRMADTFEMEFDAKAFPFSPELIRAAAVEIYLYQTDGLVGNEKNYATDQNLMIAGLIDDCSLHAGPDGLVFQVSGRDYTSLMLDRAWRPIDGTGPDGTVRKASGNGGRVPAGKPIDQTIQDLVNECTQTNGHTATLKVRYIGPGDVPNSQKGVAKTTTQAVATTKPVTAAKHSRTAKKGIPVSSGKNYWDVIYSTCLQHGLIVFVKGFEVLISTPQILSQESAGRVRKVAYGRNLESLEVERHLAREQVPQIVVSSYNADTGQTLEAVWPTSSTKPVISPDFKIKGKAPVAATSVGATNAKGTAIGTVKESIRRFTFPGVTKVDQLTDIAKTIYQNLGRAEAKVRFSTMDLRDLSDDPDSPGGKDLLQLRPADPVQIGFDEVQVEMLRDLSVQQREARMLELGYSQEVASLVATEFDRINQFKQPYYVKDVTFSWANSTGLSLQVEAINFINVKRDDKS